MKKLLALATFLFVLQSSMVAAQDVWAYEDNDTGCSVYIDDTTIVWNSARTDLKVVTKEVRNGNLVRNVRWNIGKVGNEWRYETSRMKGGHDSRLTPGSWADSILQICMNY